jgi:histidinol-phosphate aminotransferase
MNIPDVPEYISSLVPYPPGKPIEELEREYGVKDPIKLASNENPLGPSPKALEAAQRALPLLHRYPDGSGYYLKQKISEKLGVRPEQLVLGNGSNDLIDFLIRVYVRPGIQVISSEPSFLVYRKMVQIAGGENVVVPLREFRHDLDAIADAVTAETRIIFLDNPNNPCATVLNRTDFDALLQRLPDHVIVVLDGAYEEFVRDPECPMGYMYPDHDPRVVGLRTFSKSYGLAGLRVGYGIMDPGIASMLDRVRQPFNVNSVALAAAEAALDDTEHLEKTLQLTWDGLDMLAEELQRMGCKVMPGHTNFMLVDTGRDAGEIYEAMLRKGVIIRAMGAYGFPSYIRITVGMPEENTRFLRAFSEVMS